MRGTAVPDHNYHRGEHITTFGGISLQLLFEKASHLLGSESRSELNFLALPSPKSFNARYLQFYNI